MSHPADERGALYEAILAGDADTAARATQSALAENISPQELIHGQMIPAMDEVGRRFETGDCFIPEMLIAARAMRASLELLRPLLADCGGEPAGRIVIGTVAGDLHDIGKDLVASMLEGGGFDVTNLGVDVSQEKFVHAARDGPAQIVALSALLTTTMGSMQSVIEALDKAGLRTKVKVMVGGAPVTDDFAKHIGADGYSSTANGAVRLARRLISG